MKTETTIKDIQLTSENTRRLNALLDELNEKRTLRNEVKQKMKDAYKLSDMNEFDKRIQELNKIEINNEIQIIEIIKKLKTITENN